MNGICSYMNFDDDTAKFRDDGLLMKHPLWTDGELGVISLGRDLLQMTTNITPRARVVHVL